MCYQKFVKRAKVRGEGQLHTRNSRASLGAPSKFTKFSGKRGQGQLWITRRTLLSLKRALHHLYCFFKLQIILGPAC